MLSCLRLRILSSIPGSTTCDSQCVGGEGSSRQPDVLNTRGSSGFAQATARPFVAQGGFSNSCPERFSSAGVHQRKFASPLRVILASRYPSGARFQHGNGVVRATGANADADADAVADSSKAAGAYLVDGKLQTVEEKIEKFGELISIAFPIWVGLACVGALALPSATLWIKGRVQVVALSVTMLGMGMTLSLEDFQAAFALPKELFAGILLQYTVMPSAGYVVSRVLQLPPHYAAGLILVACCPGGTASNIVTYLARGNVALSVLMTAASTFLAVVMTPVLTAKLVGQYINVDASSLFFSTVQVVLLPVIGGAILNNLFHRFVKKIALVAPTIAVINVAILVAGAVGQNAAAILASGGQVVLAVLALHSAGFAGGYILSRLLRLDESSSRTISIEVGMQNSVLGVVLATQHFSNPLTAVPCAVSSVCHSLIGSTLAGIWRLSVIKGDVTQHAEPQVGLG